MTQLDLLRKTELRIEQIELQDANLSDIAATVADALGMEHNEVLVTDVQVDAMTIDILRTSVDGNRLVGKKDEVLQRLAQLAGVRISEKTSIHSQGMLGWIALDGTEARQALKRSKEMAEEIRRKISRRAIVFSTGLEVASGQVKDTNTPTIAQRLQAGGYSVTSGPTLEDDKATIAAHLRQAIDDYGFGLAITTGGVGAEDKDNTVEAVLMLDPDAATPYICRFEVGTGRHCKDGVRIAVGQVLDAMIVALPGPNDEVKASLDVLIEGLECNADKHSLAEDIASNLRELLREKMKDRRHEHIYAKPQETAD